MRGKVNYKPKNILPDPIYDSVLISKFINYVMRGGKKVKAQKIVYKSFDIVSKKTKKKPLDIFEQAIKNVGPYLEVKSRRVGGANYQVPTEVSRNRRMTLAMRWIVEAAKSEKGKPMYKKLANQLILASQEKGDAVKKKEDMHKMAEANKAFAHFGRR